jgi:SNF2 family DNA or RNA helicase
VDVVFLSLQSMASGLNLETANHVIILTPLGEPFERADQIERQAIGRCHRVGQTRKVHVQHILVRNSLEQQIYERRVTWRNQQETKEE